MLNRLTLKNKLIISLSFTALTVLLFSIAVFGLLKSPFDWHVLLNYVFVGVGVGIYFFILTSFKYSLAFMIFIVGYIIAFVSLFYMFAHSGEGFADLAGIILWMITIGLVVALGIAVEIIFHSKRQTRLASAHQNGEVVDVDVIEHDE
ncbi:hypothetical protein AOC36_02750 [Erysipelothrix larvae]|uniref:Uncharacterized protein n=1 Tax=Erysipelothrix larvae TaxID=1514105 RepID=A0A109UGQ3_9FIRM|nr:hypothetical protein [Erysipelothrix larvae]AMC92941.1 hypothetical protein AOC36_02750 [Erysipelothrix larvae]